MMLFLKITCKSDSFNYLYNIFHYLAIVYSWYAHQIFRFSTVQSSLLVKHTHCSAFCLDPLATFIWLLVQVTGQATSLTFVDFYWSFVSLLSFWSLLLGGGSGAFSAQEEGRLWGYWPEVGKGKNKLGSISATSVQATKFGPLTHFFFTYCM